MCCVQVYRLICRASVEDQMLDRIRRKLFLSVKLMGTSNTCDSSYHANMGSHELMDILRKGSSALNSVDDEMNLGRFLNASIHEILELSRQRESARDAKMRKELSAETDVNDERLVVDAEAEQRKLLSGVAQVRSRLFEGKLVKRGDNSSTRNIAKEWKEMQKRARVDRTVMVDGMAFVIADPFSVAVRLLSSISLMFYLIHLNE